MQQNFQTKSMMHVGCDKCREKSCAGNGWRPALRLPTSCQERSSKWRFPMKPQATECRNPFHVMDVPDPNDRQVLDFACGATLAGTADDENAKAWAPACDHDQSATI